MARLPAHQLLQAPGVEIRQQHRAMAVTDLGLVTTQQHAQILDGKATAAAIRAELRAQVEALAARGVVPGLGTVLVGDDPGSRSYVAGKHRACAEVGIASISRELPATASQADVESVIRELN